MPQKKNPDVPELIRGKSGRVFGSLFSLMTIMKGLPLAYNRDLQEDKEPLFDTVRTIKGVLGVLAPLVESMKIRPEKMLLAAEGGFMNATDLADYLVAKNLPFREAHSIAGQVVRRCLDKQLCLGDLALTEYQEFSPLFAQDLFTQIELKNVVASKKSKGGTSFVEVQWQRVFAKDLIKKNEAWLSEHLQKMMKVEETLFLNAH
jgi:argininosuccinate lyase